MKVMVPNYILQELEPKLRAINPEIEVVGVSVDGEWLGDLDDLEVLFRFFPNDLFSDKGFDAEKVRKVMVAAPKLRWIHSHSIGVSELLFPELVESDVILTNSAGIHEIPVVESVMALILAMAKRLPEHFQDQQRRKWQRIKKLELRGMTVGIIGLGRIGREVARLCKCFGMRVLATKRDVSLGDPNVDIIFPKEKLPELLKQSDFVVVTVALNSETRGILGELEFKCMKPSAYLVNIARGQVIDERALLRALKEGWIAGACLDVFWVEPLPPDSEFYGLSNVIITPHNSASSPQMKERVLRLFLENFRRYIRGEPLLNVVDKRKEG